MIEWIRVSRRIATDPKTLEIAGALNIPKAQAVGHLVALFARMCEEAPDGRIGHLHPTAIESWAEWEGKRGRLAPLILRLLTDADGVVTAWDRHNGASIRKAAADAERQRRFREGKGGGGRENPPAVTRDVTRDVTPSERGTSEVDGDGDGEERSSDGGVSSSHRGRAVPSAALPPGDPTVVGLPPATRALFAKAYAGAAAARIADVEMQALATLSKRGAKLERGVFVHAVDAAHLEEASRAVLRELPRLRDPDKAIRVLLQAVRETWPEANARREREAFAGPPPRADARSAPASIGAIVPRIALPS